MPEHAPAARTPPEGLTDREVEARLADEGYNELPHQNQRTLINIIIDVLREPMLALLLIGGLIYLVIGEPLDAGLLLVFACFSVVTTVVQETRSERVLEALRDLTSPRAVVIRNGESKRIAGREVVRGDLVMLAEGDRVPADALLLRAQDLQTDESLLTGESVPVHKTAAGPDDQAAPRPGGDNLPFVFSGALIVRGTGLAQVTATGPRSEIGRIGQSLHGLETEPPRLRKQVQRLVLFFAVFGVATSILAVVLYGTLRGDWLEGILAGIALGMSMLPEEFPVVLTVFMVMGAWRISKARVLTRRAGSIETLGSATVLCTDKTGTLTQNRMSIAELRAWCDGGFDAPEKQVGATRATRDLAEFGVLASERDPFDPMEQAFHEFGRKELGDTIEQQLAHWDIVRTYGLRPDLLAVTRAWQREDGDGDLVVAAKGAPESIAELCRLDEDQRAILAATIDQMAGRGLRVLGIAQASHKGTVMPQSQRDFAFRFLGLVGLADPLRPGVTEAIAECRTAGIRVVMITGDYPATASAIATEAGIDQGGVITGDELTDLSDDVLQQRVKTATIFARILPEQKLRIVTALKANGEVVAMTGDGVNDAPSLKAAHIGVAMGGRGTDVAREASSIVLLDDDFGSVVTAVRLGRRIFDNLRKAMSFIFAVHIPIAGMAILPLLTGMPIIFAPVHIAFLEMVIDPVCTLVFESETEEKNVMKRPPREPDQPLFTFNMVVWGLLQGILAFALVAAVYLWSLYRGMPAAEVRALTFFSLVLVIVSLIFANRSFSASLRTAVFRPNRAFLWVLLVVAATLSLSMLWPFARDLFNFGPLHAPDLILVFGVGLASLIITEQLKRLWHRHLFV